MKKITSILILVLLLAALLVPLAARAAAGPLIFDDVGKITEKSLGELNDYAREISDAHQLNVAFFLVSNTTGQSLVKYAEDRYLNVEKLGPDGFALAHDIENRKWTVVSFGKAEKLITEDIEDRLWDTYNDGDTYYSGVLAYLEEVSAFFAETNWDAQTAPETAAGTTTEPTIEPTTEPAAGPGKNNVPPDDIRDGYVFDETGTLTSAQIATLNEKAAAISENYGCDAYIWFVDLVPEEFVRNYDEIYFIDNSGLYSHIASFFRTNDLGCGDDKNGMIFFMEVGRMPDERTIRNIQFYRSRTCEYVFGESNIERLDNQVRPLSRDDDAYGDFFRVADAYLAGVESGFSLSAARNSVYPEAVRNGYVFDETETLVSEQVAILNKKAAALAEKRKCDVYIWIVKFVPEKYDKSMDDLEAYIDMFYWKNDLGYGDEKNGIVLLLETGDVQGERDYMFYTYGPCKSVFSNSARESLLDEHIVPLFISAFGNGNFFAVADTFLDRVEIKFASSFLINLVMKLAATIFIPVIIASVICRVWKKQMKTVKTATMAGNYIPADGFRLTNQSEIFMYRITSRVYIRDDDSSSSSGGGGGSSSSSSGRSSGGKV